jgi:predicted house-cleaning noncanonical NTP pyrophosphatase (MazG superfamily)
MYNGCVTKKTVQIKKKKGRPTSYRPEYVKEVSKYLSEAVPENMDIPTMEGLALRLDVEIKTLYNWSKVHKDFLHAIRRLKKEQKQHLIKIGIFGGKEINPTIVALMLKVNHKMVETSRQDITSKGKKIRGNTIVFKDFSNETES